MYACCLKLLEALALLVQNRRRCEASIPDSLGPLFLGPMGYAGTEKAQHPVATHVRGSRDRTQGVAPEK
jgi:hypothetical protein